MLQKSISGDPEGRTEKRGLAIWYSCSRVTEGRKFDSFFYGFCPSPRGDFLGIHVQFAIYTTASARVHVSICFSIALQVCHSLTHSLRISVSRLSIDRRRMFVPPAFTLSETIAVRSFVRSALGPPVPFRFVPSVCGNETKKKFVGGANFLTDVRVRACSLLWYVGASLVLSPPRPAQFLYLWTPRKVRGAGYRLRLLKYTLNIILH